jgi:hypothetical protein
LRFEGGFMSRRRAAVGGWAGAPVVAAAVWLGANGPTGLEQALYRRMLTGRNRCATDLHTLNRAANTDEISKIEVEKRTRITQLVYESGLRLERRKNGPISDTAVS